MTNGHFESCSPRSMLARTHWLASKIWKIAATLSKRDGDRDGARILGRVDVYEGRDQEPWRGDHRGRGQDGDRASVRPKAHQPACAIARALRAP